MAYIIRKPEVMKLLGFSKATLHRRLNKGLVPPAISLGDRAVGWVDVEIMAVQKAMIKGQTQEQIRALVAEMHEKRKAHF